MKKDWKALWENKTYLFSWIFLLFLVLVTLKLACIFLAYNESRISGVQLNDIVLQYLPVSDVSTPLFAITWVCILTCLPVALRTPKKSMVVFISILLMAVARSLTLYLVPLQPPIDIIPLRDTFLEGSFYDNKVMVRDLFFSGHTANLALIFFLIEIKWIKVIVGICTFVVAFLLLKQHVHYTVDVVAAPFFAYAAYRVARMLTEKILEFVLAPKNKKIGNHKSAIV
ncbi:MAG: hypothetical protein ACI9P5_003799 [Saprospiraceae bacterium]|jgi:hypothetical protein